MTRETLSLSLLIPLLLLVFSAVEAQKAGIAKTQSGKFQVRVSDGLLFLEANEGPLVQIFEEIGKQARITFETTIAPEEKITIRLDRVPIEAGIRQLAKNVTVFYDEDPNDKTRRIAKVVVLSDRKEGVSGPTQSPSKSTNVNEPPPQPEPFKFEFDPGKFAEKQKTRKQ
jgi:hypothetical protein